MRIKNAEIKGLFDRAYDFVKATAQDMEDLKEYTKRVFNSDTTPSPEMLHQFNNLIVQKADEIAKPKVTELLNLMASMVTKKRGDVYKYIVPQVTKAKVAWTANGSGVDLVRVEAGKSVTAEPATLSAGFQYEPTSLVEGDLENFQKLINDVANAKVRLYTDALIAIMNEAISTGEIPSANVVTGSNLTLQDYSKVASTLSRYGGRPLFVADTLMIDYFAQQQATDVAYSKLLTEKLKEELLTALNPTTIGRTTAINLVNPFVDETNSKVELPVNIGYMFAGGVNQKPFVVVEYGGLRQATEQDMEDERVKMVIRQDAHVSLLFGQAIGYVKEDAAVTL